MSEQQHCEEIEVTRTMIAAGIAVLSPWHFYGGDDVVTDEEIVKEIFRKMQAAATPSLKTHRASE